MDLGFCDTAPGAIRSRNVRVKFIQDVTGAERVVSINQLGEISFNCTYYQWGRKDPMPPAIVNTTTIAIGTGDSIEKQLYNLQGAPITRPASYSGVASIGSAISTPLRFIGNNNRNWSDRYDNLWNTNVVVASPWQGADIYVCKTIYDPSPAGYKIPNRNAFSGFTYSGKNVPEINDGVPGGSEYITTDEVAVEDLDSFSTLLGYYFYLDQMDHSKGVVFFPRTGSRNFDNGRIVGVGIYADHTTAASSLGSGASACSVLKRYILTTNKPSYEIKNETHLRAPLRAGDRSRVAGAGLAGRLRPHVGGDGRPVERRLL